MSKPKKVQFSELEALLKQRFGDLSAEECDTQLSALGSALGLEPKAKEIDEAQYQLGVKILDVLTKGHAENYQQAKDWIESQANVQLVSSITQAKASDVSSRSAEEILSEIDTLDRLANGTATNVAALLARDGFANAQEARKAYNLLYAQRLREIVESGEFERQMYAMQEEQPETLLGKPLNLVEQAQALIASRTSRALPEDSSS